MGNLGAEKAKNQGLGWQQGCGGGRIGESPRGKMGKNGESSRGKMGKNGEKWGKMGENGEEMGRKWGQRGPVAPPKFPYFPPFSPTSPPFSPIFPHFPPFSPIFPHFSLPWVHCGYVCGYSTRHRSRVLLSPEGPTKPVSVVSSMVDPGKSRSVCFVQIPQMLPWSYPWGEGVVFQKRCHTREKGPI